MLTRRSALRSLSVAALAVSAARLLSGCADDPGPRVPDPDGVAGVELVSSDVERSAADPAAIPAAVASLHALGAGLAGAALPGSENAALSPYSVGVALGMAVVGARGATERAMLDVLAAPDGAGLARGLNGLTRHIEGLAGPVRVAGEEKELVLDAANAVFGQRGTTWEQPFLDTLAREYGTGLRAVDFGAGAEAATAVNAWVAEATHDRIEEIVPAGGLDPLTRLVLVNALYLDAPWAVPFEESGTADRDFHRADGSVVRVPTMTDPTRLAALGSGDGWRSARLPYAGGTLAMTVVLPDEGRLADVEELVASGGLPDLLAAPQEEGPVDLALPTFTFRADLELTDALGALGMGVAFTPEADLGAMTTDEPLVIARVAHRVFIAVDEHGTEAAAVTSVEVGATSAPEPGEPFVVDRPFLFVVHDLELGTPLFLGRVSDPSAT